MCGFGAGHMIVMFSLLESRMIPAGGEGDTLFTEIWRLMTSTYFLFLLLVKYVVVATALLFVFIRLVWFMSLPNVSGKWKLLGNSTL